MLRRGVMVTNCENLTTRINKTVWTKWVAFNVNLPVRVPEH
jgi:hypothetical protein